MARVALASRKTQKKEIEMDVQFPWAWLLAEWSTKLAPLTGPMRERHGEGIEGGVIGPSGGSSLVGQAGLGVIFFLPRVTLLTVGDRRMR